MSNEEVQSEAFSAESYFATQPPPASLEEDVARAREFIQKQIAQGRKVVLVTSGGTTVPLELNVVRFLDNFSAGTRGATSAEYFLRAGYSVIFMHHDSEEPAQIDVKAAEHTQLIEVLSQYKRVQKAGTLHTLTFVTVNDYLWLLRAVSQELVPLGRLAMFYLAAAVSDFFLPRQKMSEHKIQSGKGSLHIEMDQVPKILKPLVNEWTREGYIVSFKLETDETLLVPKARKALARYGHQVVIGNDLHRRKFEVVFVSPKGGRPVLDENGEAEPDPSQFAESWVHIDPATNPTREIEEDIVAELVRRHRVWTGES